MQWRGREVYTLSVPCVAATGKSCSRKHRHQNLSSDYYTNVMRFSCLLPVHEQRAANRDTGRNCWRLPLMLAWLQLPQSVDGQSVRVWRAENAADFWAWVWTPGERVTTAGRGKAAATAAHHLRNVVFFSPKSQSAWKTLWNRDHSISLSMNMVCTSCWHGVFGKLEENLIGNETFVRLLRTWSGNLMWISCF